MLDRTKEPGSNGEPLYLDVARHPRRGPRARRPGDHPAGHRRPLRPVVQGVHARHGRRHLRRAGAARRRDAGSPIGINDDVGGTSLPYDPTLDIEEPETLRAVFYGLGSDGTVGANKNTIKILGADPDVHAQAYFVYDSKKSGGLTVSHLRFGPHPIHAPYLVSRAGFVGCHHLGLLDTVDVLALRRGRRDPAAQRPAAAGRGVGRPARAGAAAGHRQAAAPVRRRRRLPWPARPACPAAPTPCCRPASSRSPGCCPPTRRSSGSRRRSARPTAGAGRRWCAATRPPSTPPSPRCTRCRSPWRATSAREMPDIVPADAPEFVRTVTAAMMAGRGDDLPVSAMPVDGTFPSGTTAYEKRRISDVVAAWDPDTCIQCGTCSFVCPHSVIRSKFYDGGGARRRPRGLPVGAAQRRRPARLRATPCRSTSRTAPAAACASRPARSAPWATRDPQGDQPRAARPGARAGAREHRASSRPSRSTTAPASTSARCAAPSSSSRCSSSPGRAPGAARRPTSRCSPSCSVSG